MEWPQYTYLALNLIGIGICLTKNGQPKTGYHSFISDVLCSVPAWFLLYQGGFFK